MSSGVNKKQNNFNMLLGIMSRSVAPPSTGYLLGNEILTHPNNAGWIGLYGSQLVWHNQFVWQSHPQNVVSVRYR